MAESDNGGVRLRIVSALVMIPLAITAVWWGWPWLPALVIAASAGLGIEWACLVANGPERHRALIIATPVGATVLVAFAYPVSGIILALVGSAAVAAQTPGWPTLASLWAAGGTLWLALGGISFLWLAAVAGRVTVLWLLALVWSVDITAYVVGRAVGGPKLAPALSPNKTWAGFGGGLAGAALAGWSSAQLAGGVPALIVPVSLLLGVAAQLGDLAESTAKRRFNVKDSGSLIPGHGGLLDRLDSLLAAALLLGLMTLAAGASPLRWPWP